MAFEMPLESDRADDVAPPLLLRPIMWVLGGRSKNDDDYDENTRIHQPDVEADASCRSSSTSTPPHISEIDQEDVDLENLSTGKISPRSPPPGPPPPGVIRASEGDFDGGSSSDSENEEPTPPLSGTCGDGTMSQMAELSLSGDNDNKGSALSLNRSQQNQQSRRLGRGSKLMSWSDERGNDLVAYSDADRQMSNPDLTAKPKKSAMKKSSGPVPSSDDTSTNTTCSNTNRNRSKYLPSGIVGGKGGGVIMPSGGGIGMPSFYPTNSKNLSLNNGAGSSIGGGSSSVIATGPQSGTFSPQWGWYISTTPPSPDKFYAAPNGKKSSKTGSTQPSVPETKPADHPAPVFRHTNPSPVFKKGGVPSATMGWPSVPL